MGTLQRCVIRKTAAVIPAHGSPVYSAVSSASPADAAEMIMMRITMRYEVHFFSFLSLLSPGPSPRTPWRDKSPGGAGPAQRIPVISKKGWRKLLSSLTIQQLYPEMEQS